MANDKPSWLQGVHDGHKNDRPAGNAHTTAMNDITREEINAKLETIEVKMDARMEAVSAKIDAFVAVQSERDKRMEAALNLISSSHGEIKSGIGSMKTTMIVTGVSSVLAIVIGIAGFNAMLTSNMIASFQMGRSEQAYQKPVSTPEPNSPAPSEQK
ncbi:hypothetical protein ACTACV_12650 [Pseudomonas syringae]|uniref:hypothetical protein n=1 Tax=Pseudomonas syringae TaxID=317 RepID=UPI003F74E36C